MRPSLPEERTPLIQRRERRRSRQLPDNTDDDRRPYSLSHQKQEPRETYVPVSRGATPVTTNRRRPLSPVDGYSGGLPTFAQLAPDYVASSPPRQRSHNKKEDRRSWFTKARQFLKQTLVFPTLGYQNLSTNDDAPHRDTASWKCTCGTGQADGVWLNYTDQAGTLMALIVWLLIAYCGATMLVLARRGHLNPATAAAQCTLSALLWACHAKTMLTDPGTIPATAVPLVTKGVQYHTMCSVCQSYKPDYTHHCRICNRCISHMDHHCPWMNNCIGAGNLKHFALFLGYAWIASASALLIFGWNYFSCASDNCQFQGLEVQLVRAMTGICLGTLLFTSSMLMSVIYGVMTGTGTIDRLKQKADATWHLADEEATRLEDIMGTGSILSWFLPVDPQWPDFGRIHGYTTTEQLVQNAENA